MNGRRNWFWGIFFVLAGICVLISQLGGFAGVGWWQAVITVLLAALLVESIRKTNFVGICLSAGLMLVTWRNTLFGWLGWRINTWVVVLAAVLVGVGLTIIIKPRPRHAPPPYQGGYPPPAYGEDGAPAGEPYYQAGSYTPPMAGAEVDDDNHPVARVDFGGKSRYLHATCLEYGRFTASFGNLEVFLDHATLSPGGAELFIDCSFGHVKLYVPRHWLVEDRMTASLGAVTNDRRLAHPAEDAPRLVLVGSVSFGNVEIQYI